MLRSTRFPLFRHQQNQILTQKVITVATTGFFVSPSKITTTTNFAVMNHQYQEKFSTAAAAGLLINSRKFASTSNNTNNNSNTTESQQQQQPKQSSSTSSSKSTNSASNSSASNSSSSAASATGTAATSQFMKVLYTWQLGILGGIGLCMGVGTMFYVFWQPFRSDATLQGTEVASNVLSDARVREGAVQITKEVVESVLKDPSSVELLVGVLTRLLQQPGTKVATIIYLEELFNDPLTQDLAKRLIIDVARDDWTKDSLSDIARVLVLDLLKEAVVKKALTDLLLRSATDALRNEELQRTTSQSVRKTVAGVVIPWS